MAVLFFQVGIFPKEALLMLTACWQQVAAIPRTTLQRIGDLSMMILQAFAARDGFGPVWRTQVHAFVWARLISFNCGDFRWTIAATALRLLGAVWAFAERQFAQWARRVLRRAWQGARFAAELSDADTMVAAGRR
ncbi:MAG: hypothetical protein ABI192_14420 [Bradyrhizobium sp.]